MDCSSARWGDGAWPPWLQQGPRSFIGGGAQALGAMGAGRWRSGGPHEGVSRAGLLGGGTPSQGFPSSPPSSTAPNRHCSKINTSVTTREGPGGGTDRNRPLGGQQNHPQNAAEQTSLVKKTFTTRDKYNMAGGGGGVGAGGHREGQRWGRDVFWGTNAGGEGGKAMRGCYLSGWTLGACAVGKGGPEGASAGGLQRMWVRRCCGRVGWNVPAWP